ncbi:MAG: class I SAM-dependent methyltransferase [Anaerolineae bacterium]|nr:class I SAM-dependent methyltransferase [Anaerolineae bacterium]
MDKQIRDFLRDLNQKFYDTFAGEFASSRGRTEPGFERLLAQVKPGSRVLALGCGHGRVAFLLPAGCSYTGVDFSTKMLAQVKASGQERDMRFVVADLSSESWPADVGGQYDWITIRAVFQHIPGYTARTRILRQATTLLAPGGRIVLANWQFLAAKRLHRRIQAWSEVGLSETEVENGDYLLDWQRGGRGLRYVHLVGEAETKRLAAGADLTITEMFRADGRENNLTLYAVLSWSKKRVSAAKTPIR